MNLTQAQQQPEAMLKQYQILKEPKVIHAKYTTLGVTLRSVVDFVDVDVEDQRQDCWQP